MRTIFLLSLLSVMVAVSCSDDDNKNPADLSVNDSSGTVDSKGNDTGQTADAAPEVTKLDCQGDCTAFVLNSVVLPTAVDVGTLGEDLDGDTKIDNALAAIILALATTAPDVDLQAAINTKISAGNPLHLLNIKAKDLASEASAKVQALIGKTEQCCAKPEDATACAEEANKGCFSGSHTFDIDPQSPKNLISEGAITDHKFSFGPGKFRLLIPMTDVGTLEFNMKKAFIKGTISADGKTITDGTLAGAAPKEDMDKTFVPVIAKLITAIINDTSGKIDEGSKNLLAGYFDLNSDKTVSEEETRKNEVVAKFIDGDVDVDNDGKKESSIGVRFTAIKAVIAGEGGDKDAGSVASDAGVSKDASVVASDATGHQDGTK